MTKIPFTSHFFSIYLFVHYLTITHCAPQGGGGDSSFDDSLQCFELQTSGYECTARSLCVNGYIDEDTVDGTLLTSQNTKLSFDAEQFDVSAFECPAIRQDDDDDEFSDTDQVCCRKPEFVGEGMNCRFWKTDGFDCVTKSSCEEDGHYLSINLPGAVQRQNDLLDLDFTMFDLARKASCDNTANECCRNDSYFGRELKMKMTEKQQIPDVDPEPQEPRCGIRHPGGLNIDDIRISGVELGQRIAGVQLELEPEFGEWPHMCLVFKSIQFQGKLVDFYQCGASLISAGVVLTAAHCISDINVSDIKVRCGDLELSADEALKPHEDQQPKHVSIHPAFNDRNLYYDFALIHVTNNFKLDDHVFPICLPNQLMSLKNYRANECYVTGWGKDKSGPDGGFSPSLKQASMSTVDSKRCQSLYQGEKTPAFELHSSFICAQGGDDGQGTCTGDGGSPLVCPNPDRTYMQVGIVAWGEKDCTGKLPDVFADVSTALGFIDWATKCVEGQDTDLFGLSGYKRWAKRQYCLNIDRIDDIKVQLTIQGLPNEGSLRREWRQRTRENKKFENAIMNCATGPKEFDCSIQDYVKDLDEFKDAIDEDDNDFDNEIVDYDDLLRTDVVQIRSDY